MSTTRRGFICGCSSAVAAYAGTHFNTLAFGDPGDEHEIFVSVFLRGGMDALSFVLPIDGADRGHYEAARDDIQVPTTGLNAAIPLDAQFGIHPGAAALHPLYQSGKVAIVLATGIEESNRSHFDSMAYMELGTPGQTSGSTGWLTRHLAGAKNIPSEIVMPSLATGSIQPTSLRGSLETLAMDNVSAFSLEVGPWRWRPAQRTALRSLYGGQGFLHDSGTAALDALDIVQLSDTGNYQPANGAQYPSGSFGSHLRTIAQMIKLDLGLHVATVDFGGWDSHIFQGNDGGGYLRGHFEELCEGLAAFYTDLDGAGGGNYTDRLTVAAQTEFGRRFFQNADLGTDHGHGSCIILMGGHVNGGLHGTWPGLAPGQLFDSFDLDVTTDFRRVLSEILIRRLGNNRLFEVFPGYTGYSPLGVVQGQDLPPLLEPPIFEDGFESGDTSAWSATSP